MITARPPNSGMIVTGSEKLWVVSSDTPKKAATQPTPASPIAGKPSGESGLAGGESSNVNRLSTSAPAATAATIQNSGRQAFDSACRPPMKGPSATAPKMHMFMMTTVIRSFSFGKPIASGGTAEISNRLVQRPWIT